MTAEQLNDIFERTQWPDLLSKKSNGEYVDDLVQIHWTAWCDCARALEPKWLPIETAPKDGTLIDLWFGGEFKHRRSDCYWGLPHHCCGEMGSLCDSDWHGLSEGWVDVCFNEPISEFDGGPTHWMPLPEQPKAAMSAALEGKKNDDE